MLRFETSPPFSVVFQLNVLFPEVIARYRVDLDIYLESVKTM